MCLPNYKEQFCGVVSVFRSTDPRPLKPSNI